MEFKNGDIYDGHWEDGNMNGIGCYLFFESKKLCLGLWKDGKPENVGWVQIQEKEEK